MPERPTTGDVIEYDSRQWKVTAMNLHMSEDSHRLLNHREESVMAKDFNGPEIFDEIDAALDKGLARFLLQTQSKLAAANPVDTGRMASSWFVGKDGQNLNHVLRIGPSQAPGAWRLNSLIKIRMGDDYYLNDSVPYAERVARSAICKGRSPWRC